jgi:hypothetical protein
MLIVDDKTLAAAGLDYATALALLKPAAEELIVHVTRCLEAPPTPQPAADVPEPQADSPSISSLVVVDGATDFDSDDDEGTSAVQDDVVGPAADDWAIGRTLRQATAYPAAEDRGFNFTALADMARDKRMTLTYVGGVYTLIGAFKMMHFHSLQQVADAMRHNRYD